MPWGDGTGPFGEGPMTGRGRGYCAGYNTPGYMNPGFGGRWVRGGRGFGRAWFGRGRGFRYWARATGLPGWYRANIGMPAFGRWAPIRSVQPITTQSTQRPQFVQPALTKDQEIQFLEDNIKYLEEERKLLDKDLDALRKRLNELKKKD